MLKRTRLIEFRVDEDEYMRIINNAKAAGCPSYAAYLRDLALRRSLLIESKIIETNRLVHQVIELLRLSRCIPSTAFHAVRSASADKSARQSPHSQDVSSEEPLDPEL